MKTFFNLKNIFVFTFCFLFFLSFSFVFAVDAVDNLNCDKNKVGLSTIGIDLLSDPTGRSCPNLSNNLTIADNIGSKVSTIVRVIFGFFSTVGLIAFVYAGVTILISNGDQKAYGKGWNIIRYTFTGMIIMIFSYAIANFLLSTIPSFTGQPGSSGGSSSMSYVENGDFCAGNTEDSAIGKCYYLLKTYIDSNSGDFNEGYPIDWNKDSIVCGRSAGFCATEGGITYCLRCVDKTKTLPADKIYNPQSNANKKSTN